MLKELGSYETMHAPTVFLFARTNKNVLQAFRLELGLCEEPRWLSG